MRTGCTASAGVSPPAQMMPLTSFRTLCSRQLVHPKLRDGPDRFGVSVPFLAAGAERVRQATATHIGRPMAILIDGVVVMAPVVRSPIGDSAVISGNFTQTEGERIVNGIGRG